MGDNKVNCCLIYSKLQTELIPTQKPTKLNALLFLFVLSELKLQNNKKLLSKKIAINLQ